MVKMMSGGTDSEGGRPGTGYSTESPPYYSTPSSSSGLGSSNSSNVSTQNNIDETEHIYEDIIVDPNQRLPKITGILNKDKTAVVRPVAFKPLHKQSPYPTSLRIATPINFPIRCPETSSTDQKSAYGMSQTGSLKLSLLRNSQFSLSQNSLFFEGSDQQSSSTGDSFPKTPSSLICSPSNRMMSNSYLHLDELANRQMQTPSPSDSGIAELEIMLKEKDSEINYLRKTLEQNEQVIFKVFEEKQYNWKKELSRIRAQYDNRLKMCQQRALKMEQLLMNQSYQLQHDKKKNLNAFERLRKEKEAVSKQGSEMKKEMDSIKAQLEETRWSLCQKNGEISLLKSQLKDSQNEQSSKATELIATRNKLKEAQNENEEKSELVSSLEAASKQLKMEIEDGKSRLEQCLRDLKSPLSVGDVRQGRNRTMSDMQLENEKLRVQYLDAKRAIDYERGSHENERINWLEEKEKVIRYQKQLQLNYVQMFRRNHSLERELEQLTLQLDHRDYRTIGESNC